ncbi:MAG TPA: RagB/SusD family nutrient uptake outer membrane protein, partial [Bacteroidales bacterium]|nr:RagB/SusD family nutrient uptake outer membrane protein [Bacteroidales bacterium]
MKIVTRRILVLLLLMLQVSCNDWMELIPPEGLIRQEFWNTKEDVRSVLMGAYETFSHMDAQLFKYGEIRGDMLKGDDNQSEDERKIMEGNIYPDNYMCNWSDFYTVIDYCNEVIVNAPKVKEKDHTFTDYQLKGYLAEAHFLRDLAYFYLVRIFRDVPLVLKPTESDDADFYPAKTNGDEIIDFLIQDLESVRDFATVDGYPTQREIKGRATKAAFDALLADISLWRFDYSAVITYTNRILANNDYIMIPSNSWFTIYYPGNSVEGIFEFQFNDAQDQKNGMYGMTQENSKNYVASETALDLFTKKTRNFLESLRGVGGSIAKRSDKYIIWKYVGRNNDGTTTRTGTDQNSCNFIVYRLADIYLMKAEALSQMGDYTNALDYINFVRAKRQVPDIAFLQESPASYEDFIMEERAVELAYEGKRWFDLMRMGRRDDFKRKNKLIQILVN